ncbi:hypothetical protein [Gordonia sihwensis]|uniref:hypothetical protein n=1 Tax=Gordonia sihwensis TaxID=173559 RepID=UPI003D980F68
MTIRTWTPQTDTPEILIARGTNPWLVDDAGAMIDLTTLRSTGETACGDCGPIAGVIAPMDDQYGIQRCDACSIYPGDLEAAYALAQHLGASYTVMYETAT